MGLTRAKLRIVVTTMILTIIVLRKWIWLVWTNLNIMKKIKKLHVKRKHISQKNKRRNLVIMIWTIGEMIMNKIVKIKQMNTINSIIKCFKQILIVKTTKTNPKRKILVMMMMIMMKKKIKINLVIKIQSRNIRMVLLM